MGAERKGKLGTLGFEIGLMEIESGVMNGVWNECSLFIMYVAN